MLEVEREIACSSFAGGFVPIGTDVVVVVTDVDGKDIAVVKTTAQAAPSSPQEAIFAVAEAYGKAMADVRATVFVVVGGADGNKV
ncbi:unnamed protein product [Ectocarpus sp. 12 AP-2014]